MKLVYIGTTTQYNVEIKAIKSNVLEVTGTKLPMKEKGFTLIDDEGNEYDYSEYKTLYRAIEGGYQYSNDGEIWIEPTRTIVVNASWKDDDNIEGFRPESVDVTVTCGNEVIEIVTLSEENEWKKEYPNIPQSRVYEIEATDVENYTMEVSGTVVTYTVELPEEPTIEEQLADIQDMLIDLDERVYNLEGGD